MAGIFISYRREDGGGHAGRLCDRLSARFGRDRSATHRIRSADSLCLRTTWSRRFVRYEMRPKLFAVLGAVIGACVAAAGQAQTPKPDRAALTATGILERLAERTGVYGVPPTAKTPGFIADAGWPQKLPNNWIIGQVGGLYVAPD